MHQYLTSFNPFFINHAAPQLTRQENLYICLAVLLITERCEELNKKREFGQKNKGRRVILAGNMAENEFKKVFKYYKARDPPPSLEQVIDPAR